MKLVLEPLVDGRRTRSFVIRGFVGRQHPIKTGDQFGMAGAAHEMRSLVRVLTVIIKLFGSVLVPGIPCHVCLDLAVAKCIKTRCRSGLKSDPA